MGNPIKITAVFENNGYTKTTAKMIAEIYMNDQLVKTLESNEATLRPKDEASLDAYYTPEKSGRYVVKAHIFYSNQKTNYEADTFEVGGIDYLLYSIPVLVIIILVVVYVRYYKR
jgi:hypothetical protein